MIQSSIDVDRESRLAMAANSCLFHSCGSVLFESGSPNGDRHPRDPHDARDDTVCDLATSCVSRPSETETAVDDSQSEEESTDDDVNPGEEGGSAVFFDFGVVDVTGGCLGQECADD